MEIPPPIKILRRMKALGAAADYTEAGIAGPVTVRHSRNRKPYGSEKPSLLLILVSDEPRPDELDRNAWEVVREMVVDVQVDVDLAAEDSGDDDTGLLQLMMVHAVFVASLRGPDVTWIDQLVDRVSVDSLEPDDRSTPDDGRMTRALRVLYRTRSDDENHLLAAGENG